METRPARCLILACGNTLRSDDGVGPWLAAWASKHFRDEAQVCVLARQQWTLDLVEDVAGAGFLLFLDCSLDSPPGVIQQTPVEPANDPLKIATHHLSASELLALSRHFYRSLPRAALLLTIGAGSTEFGEAFSAAVQAALPEACRKMEETVQRWLAASG
ncbi:MAG: hydrogenase maturation protease [Terracidiphilus sp.]